MEAGFIMIILVMVIGIAVLGLVLYSAAIKPKPTQGILNVDYSDPEDGPYLFLELKVPITDVVSRKQVIFDVNITEYVSQK